MAENILSSKRKNVAPTADHPMMMHAQTWQHVNGMAQDDMTSKAIEVNAWLPTLGALAGNPKVTSKDIIKAAADAAGIGTMRPSQAVSFISMMPDDPDKLRPWLKNLYAANLSALVHIKAALMPTPQPAAAPVAPAQAAPGMPPQGAPQ